MEWNFDNVKYNGKDLDRVQVDGVTVWEKAKPKFYDYLQNDGNAYIDCEMLGRYNYKIHTKFSVVSAISNSNYVQTFGCYTAPQSQNFLTLLVNVQSTGTGNTRWFNRTYSKAFTSLNEVVEVWFDKNGMRGDINFDYTETPLPSILTTSANLNIFRANGSSSKGIERFYLLQIYDEENNLIRNFVPCEYKGEYGMWDKVNNKFYGNANSSGAFTVGSEIKYYDYLQTADGAYIDTEFKPNQDSRVLADILLLNSNLTAVFGTRNNSGGPSYGAFVLWNSPALYYQYGNVTYSTYKLSDAIVNEHITIDLNKNVGILNNNSPVTCNTATFQTNYPFLIGNIHTASGIDPRPTPMKVYSFKIYDNDTLVRDYKPCLYNNQAGLWDSVECKFYGNANNTGTLTVGND